MHTRIRLSRDEQLALVGEQEHSGRPALAFCRERGVCHQSFLRWRKRAACVGGSRHEGRAAFVELAMQPAGSAGQGDLRRSNFFFPRLRSGHRLFQRPSPQKQIPSIKFLAVVSYSSPASSRTPGASCGETNRTAAHPPVDSRLPPAVSDPAPASPDHRKHRPRGPARTSPTGR
jgi:hypothetical protein